MKFHMLMNFKKNGPAQKMRFILFQKVFNLTFFPKSSTEFFITTSSFNSSPQHISKAFGAETVINQLKSQAKRKQ